MSASSITGAMTPARVHRLERDADPALEHRLLEVEVVEVARLEEQRGLLAEREAPRAAQEVLRRGLAVAGRGAQDVLRRPVHREARTDAIADVERDVGVDDRR